METKKCPFCAEEIRIEAKKCRYCGELLDEDLKSERTSSAKNENPLVVPEDIINVGIENVPSSVDPKQLKPSNLPEVVSTQNSINDDEVLSNLNAEVGVIPKNEDKGESNIQQNTKRSWLITSIICVFCGIILFIMKVLLYPTFEEITSEIVIKNIFSGPIIVLIVGLLCSPFIKNKKRIINTTLIISIGSTAFFLLGFFQAYLKDVNQVIAKPKPQSVEEILSESVKEINKICPAMVNNETRMDTAFIEIGNTIQINYTFIHYTKAELIIDEIKKNAEPGLINNYKTNPILSVFRKYKATINYQLSDKNGVFLLLIPITPDKYQ